MREFETGAIRDSDDGKFDYEGFLSPLALEAFASYMHKHRTMADGSLRSSDNWQKGFPLHELMKSLLRHTMTVWRLHRNWRRPSDGGCEMIDALCGIIFNAQGYLHQLLRIGFSS